MDDFQRWLTKKVVKAESDWMHADASKKRTKNATLLAFRECRNQYNEFKEVKHDGGV